MSLHPCSSYGPCLHCVSHVNPSLAGRVQKTFAVIQCVHTSRSRCFLCVLFLLWSEESGWCRNRVADFCGSFRLQCIEYTITILFQAGSFLYVATVLQPVSRDHSSTGGVGTRTRIFFLVLGIFTPFMLGSLLDHEHSRSTVT